MYFNRTLPDIKAIELSRNLLHSVEKRIVTMDYTTNLCDKYNIDRCILYRYYILYINYILFSNLTYFEQFHLRRIRDHYYLINSYCKCVYALLTTILITLHYILC